MKLIYKGKYTGDESTLPTREITPDVVPFREPQSMKQLAIIANAIAFVLEIACFALFFWRVDWDFSRISLIGMALSMLSLYPHELLHAVCFRDTVYFFTNWKQGLLFVVGTEDMSKARFVFLSMLPNLVFGIIPFALFLLWPQLTVLGSLGAVTLGMGGGDYMNVFNCLTQVPNGALIFMSGMRSYWYMPKGDR